MCPWLSFVSVLAFAIPVPSLAATAVESVSRIAFGPPNVLFVADWKANKIHAFTLPADSSKDAPFYNVMHLEAALKGVAEAGVTLHDLAVRPQSGEAYIALTSGARGKVSIVSVSAGGKVTALKLDKLPATHTDITDPPDAALSFWKNVPGRSYTVTDMQWENNKLYVAGLTNQSFASGLRILDYPFTDKAGLATVEMYHTAHNQMETRAPIRAMTFADLGGKRHLIAAYLCTPLVTIPAAELQDKAHIKAKTIAETGAGGVPGSLLTYDISMPAMPNPMGMLMLINEHRESTMMPLAEVEKANAGPGLTTPVPPGQKSALAAQGSMLGGVLRMAQNSAGLVGLRRDLATGHAQLVSFLKPAAMRLSDYDASEFLLPGYKPPAAVQNDPGFQGMTQMQHAMRTTEGFGGPGGR